MSSAEIGQWLAFDAIEPIGRDWERTGMQTRLLNTRERDFDHQVFLPDPIQTSEQ